MTVFMDTTTGEVNTIDELLEDIILAESNINVYRVMAHNAKSKLMSLLKLEDGHKTGRIQGQKYKCKVEMPTKIMWDQQKLGKVYSIYPHGTVVDSLVKIANYKIDMREYKKFINTTGDKEFMDFKDFMLSANLG